jgi:hypothetical protein
MLISDSHRFIFLAVPKTASSSIEQALAPHRAPITDQFNKHATCTTLARELPEAVWGTYFKFAFVRNPYDSLQSWYFYRQREELAAPDHPRHHLYTGNISFEQFVRTFSTQHIMLNQHYWVSPPALGDQNQLDFVGRYETLERDFNHICEQIGVPAPALGLVRKSANHEQAKQLWNPETRAIANDYFREDFLRFGYEMLDE